MLLQYFIAHGHLSLSCYHFFPSLMVWCFPVITTRDPMIYRLPLCPPLQSQTPNYLVNIPEIQILTIGKIAERRGVEVPPFETADLLCLDLVAPVVFRLHQHPEGHDDADLDEMAGYFVLDKLGGRGK